MMNTIGKCILAASVMCCNLAYAKPISNDELLNTPLVGLDVVKATAKNIYKKYAFDFNSTCYAGYSSIYISSAKNLVYLASSYNPISDASPPEYATELKLISVTRGNQSDGVSVKASSPAHGEVIFNFSKTDENVFDLTIKGFPLHEIDNGVLELKSTYINIKNAKRFTHADCGDFDG